MLVKTRRSLVHQQGPARALPLCLVLAVAITITLPAWARKQAPPLPFEEVATTWVGLSTDEHYMVRLVLSGDGSGTGGYTFLDGEARVFRIAAWDYEGGRIEIEPVSPEGPPSWVGPMHGRILGTTMHLEASGDDWKIEVVLRREAEMAERWNRLKRKMQVGAAAPPLPPPA